MPNTINLRLLDNKNIIAELNGIPLAQENSYKIIAGEENATLFKIASKPNQYINARYTVEMVNSQGFGVDETDIVQDTFSLPKGMAVAGYGFMQIRAYQGEEVVPFMTLKVKVWNTLPDWKDHISTEIDTSTDVQINGVSITENGVANIPFASSTKAGVAKTGGYYGVSVYQGGQSDGFAYVVMAGNTDIDAKSNGYKPITPKNLDYAIRVGLTTNTEVLSDEEQGKACEWLGTPRKHPPNTGTLRVWVSNGNAGYWDIIQSNEQSAANGNIARYQSETAGNTEYSGYLTTHTPKNPYHCANKKFVEDTVANAGGSSGGGKLYKHTLTFGGSQNLPPNCRSVFRNERATPYTTWLEILEDMLSIPFTSEMGSVCGFIYLNDTDKDAIDETTQSSLGIRFWTFRNGDSGEMYNLVANESLVDIVEEI